MTTSTDKTQHALTAATRAARSSGQDSAAATKGGKTAKTAKAAKEPKATRGRNSEAAPYSHGKGANTTWSLRRRVRGHDIFLSGYYSKTELKAAMKVAIDSIEAGKGPAGQGAHMTSVAQALQDYALERLRFLKGAQQEARRINVYLRAAGLRLLSLTRIQGSEDAQSGGADTARKRGALFRIDLVAHTHERTIPNGLHAHRKALLNANAEADKLRKVLATTPVADVTRKQLQELMDQMRAEGKAASTIALERAILRTLFNYAFSTWHWPQLKDNPATSLSMPAVDNERKRVLGAREQAMLDEALRSCHNNLVAPTLTLLRETAMRASEPLERAKWSDVDWQRKVLTLRDSKTGSREVPLSPGAIVALQQLRALSSGKPGEPIVRISYEALSAAWRRALERAGIEDLHLQDLRHTGATRMALKSGNVFLVQALTGHKTLQMAKRYVNVSADDVVEVMHNSSAAQSLPALRVPPGNARARSEQPTEQCQTHDAPSAAQEVKVDGNVVYARFERRA